MSTTPTAPNLLVIDMMPPDAFVELLGGIFEHSPWVAEAVVSRRPHQSIDALHAAMVDAVEAAPKEKRLALLAAHPELAGRDAREGSLTASSTQEQTSAGLDALSAAEMKRMSDLNTAYRTKFGFPFIVAVRDHTKASIFATFERRLAQDADTEFAEALEQVYRITRLRLDACASAGWSRPA